MAKRKNTAPAIVERLQLTNSPADTGPRVACILRYLAQHDCTDPLNEDEDWGRQLLFMDLATALQYAEEEMSARRATSSKEVRRG